MPPVPGHGQFLDQISVKTYVGTPSFYCKMCPRIKKRWGTPSFKNVTTPLIFVMLQYYKMQYFSRGVVTFLKLGVPQLNRAHFAIKTGRAHICLYTYLVQKLPVPGHGGHIR